MVTCTTPPFRAAVRLNSGVRPVSQHFRDTKNALRTHNDHAPFAELSVGNDMFILLIPMFLYFLTAAVVGFFSARYQALVVAVAGLVVAWLCIQWSHGEMFAPFVIFPTLVLYALASIAAIMASRALEDAHASDLATVSGSDDGTQA